MLNSPSKEQKLIIKNIKDNFNIVVSATAGSGKSTTCLHIAKTLPSLKILLLTYNAKLKIEIRNKKYLLFLDNLEVQSFHSFVLKYYRIKSYTDSGIQKVIANNVSPKNEFNFDLVIIDEAQDITPLYYQLLAKLLKDNKKKSQICVLGDKNQSIYSFKYSDARYLLNAQTIFEFNNSLPWKHCSLKISFRVPKTISNFINNCCTTENLIKSDKTGDYMPQYLILNIFDSNEIYTKIKKVLNSYNVDDIFILSPYISGKNNSPFKMLANMLSDKQFPCYVSNDQEEELKDEVIKNKIVFTSFHQVKGLERKVVIILGFDQGFFHYGYGKNYDSSVLPNEFYVAMTRSLEHLILIHHNQNQFIKFLNVNKIKNHCLVDKNFEKYKKILTSDEIIDNIVEGPEISVTNLVKFIPQELLNICEKNIKVKKRKIKKDTIKINSTLKIDNNHYEQISDINGVAVPLFYEFKSKNKLSEVSIVKQLYKLVNRDDYYFKNEYYFLLDYKNFINTMIIKEKMEISELLLLSTIWIAFMEKLNFKLNQISKESYNWITKEQLNILMSRMQGNINIKSSFEQEIRNVEYYEKFGKYLSGFIDCIDIENRQIWEFKCTKVITTEHFLQLAIYGYMFNQQQDEFIKNKSKKSVNQVNDKEYQYLLFNILTNEIFEIKFKNNEIDLLIKNLLISRYGKLEKKSDEEFVASTLKLLT